MDERRHRPGPEPDWEESWSFDFVDGTGTFGGFVRLALHPARQRAWYWAYLARPGRPVVVVRDHEVEVPRGRVLEVRGDGLWAQVICETLFEHWSAALEAFAVAIDEPARTWGDERGDPVALGLDLEWEMRAQAQPFPDLGYVQPAAVHGEVLVGAERLAVDGIGSYTHTWGPPGWDDQRWWAVTAGFADGTTAAARFPGWAATWPRGDGPTTPAATTAGALDTRWRHDGLPESATLRLGDVEAEVVPTALAPVSLDAGGRRRGVLVRALCSFSNGPDGPEGCGRGDGWGWAEWVRSPTGEEAGGPG